MHGTADWDEILRQEWEEMEKEWEKIKKDQQEEEEEDETEQLFHYCFYPHSEQAFS
jgi:hypothetical protein